ncbi:MAG: YecA family protein [Shimia sp.]|nr:YecA family protein [Shimia sp.]
MINGYLTAIMVAPRFVTPTEWLPPLLSGIEFSGENTVRRVLDIVMLRFGVIQDGMYDGEIAANLRTLSARKFQNWLSGFTQASAITAAWPKRALSSDDRKILKLIKEGALNSDIQATLKPLLPSWLSAMALKAVDS